MERLIEFRRQKGFSANDCAGLSAVKRLSACPYITYFEVYCVFCFSCYYYVVRLYITVCYLNVLQVAMHFHHLLNKSNGYLLWKVSFIRFYSFFNIFIEIGFSFFHQNVSNYLARTVVGGAMASRQSAWVRPFPLFSNTES